MRPRTWTPDQVVVEYNHGREERMIRLSPKRACSRCGTILGDLNEAETVIASKGRRLRPSDSECALCLGFHALLLDPAPLEPGANPATPSLTVKLLCPGTPAGVPVAGCADWGRCDCQPPAGIDYPSTEWVEFLGKRCIGSPTGEHRHLPERDQPDFPFVGAPQPGSCMYANVFTRWSLGERQLTSDVVRGEPGLHPVEVEVYDSENLVFEPIEIRAGHRAEAIPV